MARRANTSPQTLKLLDALLSQPGAWRYGYDLSKETGLKSGTLYPQLMRLEASCWLEATWEEAPQPGKPARHMYRLTTLGQTEAPVLLATRGRFPAPKTPLRPAIEEAQ
jgi:DNA-binding PadR family transcriptional regulator